MVNYVLVFRDHMIYNYNECDTYIVYKKILYTQNNKPSNNMSCNICIGTGWNWNIYNMLYNRTSLHLLTLYANC